MQDMAAGNLFSKLILRKGDELMKLSDGINRLSESMKTTILNERAAIGRLEAELGSLKGMVSSKHPDPDAINKAMRKVESEISELRKEVNRFKVESEKS
jgi:methyl-accepting chemotaxis protein